MDTRFHAVYLLTSRDPRCAGDYYIGYSVNPLRRLRQHNGELVNGACRTKRRGRPWTLVCCVSGFAEDRAALKFEWCWQHPHESARLKHTAPVFSRGLRKLPYAVGILHLLLHARLFSRLELTLHILEVELFRKMSDMALAHWPTSQKKPYDCYHRDAVSTCSTGEDVTSLGQGGEGCVLPPLVPNALLHIEETTPDEFQAKYLSHESLAAVSLSAGGGSPHLCAGAGGFLPYSWGLSALAQIARWGGEGEGAHLGRHGASPRDHGSISISSSGGTPSTLALSRRSSQEPGSGFEAAALHASRSRTPQGSSPDALRHSPRRSLSPFPLSLEGVTAPSLLTTRAEGGCQGWAQGQKPYIPLRFKYYTEADFVQEYLYEKNLLERGLLSCTFCALPLRAPYIMRCPCAPFCSLTSHIVCLAMWMQHTLEFQNEAQVLGTTTSPQQSSFADLATHSVKGIHPCGAEALLLAQKRLTLVPTQPCPCPLCGVVLHWGSLIKNLKQQAVKEKRLRSHHRRRMIEQRLQTRLERARLVSQKRRRSVARAAGMADVSLGKAAEGGMPRHRGRCPLADNSRSTSTSPPALVQASVRTRVHSRCTDKAAPSPGATQGIQQQQFIDQVGVWAAANSTLRVTEFDEHEWLDH